MQQKGGGGRDLISFDLKCCLLSHVDDFPHFLEKRENIALFCKKDDKSSSEA